jgi:outer membrane protein assembly factor BamB
MLVPLRTRAPRPSGTWRRGTSVLLAALTLGAAGKAGASDTWPALWGPGGDGRADSAVRLPAGKTLRVREAWRRPIGSGFSAIAVADARGYTAFSDGSQDLVAAFDCATGRELWRARLGETYRGHDGSKDGPASTPAVQDGRVFIVGPRGALVALEAASGKVAWSHDLKTEFGAPAPYYGFATSPLVSDHRVVVQAGGEKTSLLAFDTASGKLVWSAAHSKTAGYASPVPTTLAGTAQIVVLSNDLVYGVRPEDGSLLWSHPTGWGDEAVRSPLPMAGDRVLISGTNEAKLIELKKEGDRVTAREAWTTPRLKNSFSPTLFHEGHLYGFGSGHLLCVDAGSAEVLWREKVYGGSLIFVDGHVLILGADSGELRLARVSPRGYEERLKVPVFNAGATSVTGPAFAGGRLFLRNLEEVVALDIEG